MARTNSIIHPITPTARPLVRHVRIALYLMCSTGETMGAIGLRMNRVLLALECVCVGMCVCRSVCVCACVGIMYVCVGVCKCVHL